MYPKQTARSQNSKPNSNGQGHSAAKCTGGTTKTPGNQKQQGAGTGSNIITPERFQEIDRRVAQAAQEKNGNRGRKKTREELQEECNSLIRFFRGQQRKELRFYATDFDDNIDRFGSLRPSLVGITCEDPHAIVRVFTDRKRAEQLLQHMGEIAGKAVSFTAPYLVGLGNATKVQDGWITIDANSLVLHEDDVPDEVPDIPFAFLGHQQKRDSYGNVVTREKWNEVAKHGCGNCSKQMEYEEECEWFDGTPICTDCHNEMEDELSSVFNSGGTQ